MTHPAAAQLAVDVREAEDGGVTLTVRELRDRFGLARLTQAGREAIGGDLEAAGLLISPALTNRDAAALTSEVTITADPESDTEIDDDEVAPAVPPASSRGQFPPPGQDVPEPSRGLVATVARPGVLVALAALVAALVLLARRGQDR
ncbi:MAG: hypothetical protein AB7G37_11675 [Solirubrobacteraceae bacterium]